jgi:hypothetical protein
MNLFPELDLFDDTSERLEAYRRARSSVVGQRSRALVLVALILATAFILAMLMVGFQSLAIWVGPFVSGVSGAIGLAAANYLFRRPIQEHLRAQLNARGIPVCVRCGYNLRGNVTGRCPECGTQAVQS